MKSIKLLLTGMALTGALSLSAVSTRAETVISKDVFANGSYCHAKFESIRDETLASSHRSLRTSMTSSIFMVPATMILWGRRRFRPRRSRHSTGSPRITRIEDFVMKRPEGNAPYRAPAFSQREVQIECPGMKNSIRIVW
jgi:hypothetical protein